MVGPVSKIYATGSRTTDTLIFVFGTGLLAGSGHTVHGGAAAGPVFQNALLDQLVDNLFGLPGVDTQDFGQVVEVELGFVLQLLGQRFDDFGF